MGRCRFRPAAYRAGLVFVTLGFALLAAGYGLPTWVRRSYKRTEGLWHVCEHHWLAPGACEFKAKTDDLMLMGVRAVLGASLLTYIVTLSMALRENCCSPHFYTCCLAGRKTEVFAFLAELLGIAGMILFSVVEYEEQGSFNRLSWGHALCDAGLAVSLIGSIMMACAQQSLPAAKSVAGRIVAGKAGYENLGTNRSGSIQSRSTHSTQASPSPFTGRTGRKSNSKAVNGGRNSIPRISGPFPTQAAIAAVTAAVSPKQHRTALLQHHHQPHPGTNGNNNSSLGSPRKLSSPAPYPALDETHSSPSRRRKSSGQGKQFAGVHNQSKHQPVFSSQLVQQEWQAQQQVSQPYNSATWSENMRHDDESVRQQRALKSQMEQQQLEQHQVAQQQLEMTTHHAHTWSSAHYHHQHHHAEKAWIHHQHGQEDQHHYDRDWRATDAPASTILHRYNDHGGQPSPPILQQHHAADLYPSQASYYPGYYGPEGQAVQNGYPEYQPEGAPQWGGPTSGQYLQQPPAPQTRPDSGSFPDPPPPEQLLAYDEDGRNMVSSSYHAYPAPVPPPEAPAGPQPQPLPQSPVVPYRKPQPPGAYYHGSGVGAETVVLRHGSGHGSPASPHSPHPSSPHHPHAYMQQPYPNPHHPHLHHQTFPRQQPLPVAPGSPQPYSTFR